MTDFHAFRKIPRLSRECIVTEKIDGTNGLIYIGDDGEFLVGSRTKWIDIHNDNAGFANWAYAHKDELMTLGPGYHYGEWWGQKIQRGYDLKEKRFSLFNTSLWSDNAPVIPDANGHVHIKPACCHVVPVLYTGLFETLAIEDTLGFLTMGGSKAAPGYMNPEGVVIYHVPSGYYFKKTIIKDESPKGLENV